MTSLLQDFQLLLDNLTANTNKLLNSQLTFDDALEIFMQELRNWGLNLISPYLLNNLIRTISSCLGTKRSMPLRLNASVLNKLFMVS